MTCIMTKMILSGSHGAAMSKRSSMMLPKKTLLGYLNQPMGPFQFTISLKMLIRSPNIPKQYLAITTLLDHLETPHLTHLKSLMLAELHIRKHTAHTTPSLESRAQSDYASTPTTPFETASSPFVEDSHDAPNIRSSWQDNSALQGSDLIASPLQAGFDPCNSQTHPNYISPKASQVNLRTEASPRHSLLAIQAELNFLHRTTHTVAHHYRGR
jgi:hypothetical protein